MKLNGGEIYNRFSQLLEGNSLRSFSQATDLNYDTLKKWKQRRTVPSSEILLTISSYFHADFDWLLTGNKSTSLYNKKIAKKIINAREEKGFSVQKLAQEIEIPELSLEFYEKGIWSFSTELLNKISGILEIPIQRLLTDEKTELGHVPPQLKIYNSYPDKSGPTINQEDYISVPLTDSAIAAGQPIIQHENIEDYVLLHTRATGRRNNLVASRVEGDSMEPTLHSGDIVIIDRSDKTIEKNQMYAIFHENGLTAKYVELGKSFLILRPLNPSAQIQIVNLKEYPDPVVGRIIGAWKSF
jgi:phage repressor protein C with HTH and peptisase S24 domain